MGTKELSRGICNSNNDTLQEYAMTHAQFMELVLLNFPYAEVSEDEDGQLIIHTGLMENDNHEVVDFD